MSFILDALRKSEQERQHGEVPPISRVPLAAARHSAPAWAIAAIVLLGAALLVMSWGWWQSLSPSTRTMPAPVAMRAGTDSTPSPAAAPLQADPQPVPRAAGAQSAASVSPRTASAPTIALRELAVQTAQSASPGSASAEPGPLPNAATKGILRPSLGELRAQGIAVPELTLELHVYSADPAQRFVFINGNRYREGETLKEGPSVREILPDGVVLSAQGREFLLPRN